MPPQQISVSQSRIRGEAYDVRWKWQHGRTRSTKPCLLIYPSHPMRRDDLVGRNEPSQDHRLIDLRQPRSSSYARHMRNHFGVERSLDRPLRTANQAEYDWDPIWDTPRYERSPRSTCYMKLRQYRLPPPSRPSAPFVTDSDPISPTSELELDPVQTTKWDCLRGSLEEANGSSSEPRSHSGRTVLKTALPAIQAPRPYPAPYLKRSISNQEPNRYWRRKDMEEIPSVRALPSISESNASSSPEAFPPVSQILPVRHTPIPQAYPVKPSSTVISYEKRHRVLAKIRETTMQRLQAKLASKANI